jgi:hypothetical protein
MGILFRSSVVKASLASVVSTYVRKAPRFNERLIAILISC